MSGFAHLGHLDTEPDIVDSGGQRLGKLRVALVERAELRPQDLLPQEEELDHRDHLAGHAGAAAHHRVDQVVVELAVEAASTGVFERGLKVVGAR